VVVVNLSGNFLGKYILVFLWNKKLFSIEIAHYRVPNMPINGWWHEWTFNYDVKVDYNEVHLDLAEREAKILVWLGEDWRPPVSEPRSDASVESTPNDDTDTTKETPEN
jgi:hypothetical protein